MTERGKKIKKRFVVFHYTDCCYENFTVVILFMHIAYLVVCFTRANYRSLLVIFYSIFYLLLISPSRCF